MIYINGKKASKQDLRILAKRCRAGRETIVSMGITKGGNFAVKTV